MHRLDTRAVFHAEDRILEIDLVDLHLETPADVAALYDMLELRITETGRRWFFLINYLNCRIDPEAWVNFAARGKRLNLGGSLGTVRFNTADETGSEIERRADAEKFEANLVANRAAAIAKLKAMRDEHFRKHPEREPVDAETAARYAARISFDREAGFMEADFSDFAFTDSGVVNDFYDVIEREIAATGREKWYFLVNYRGCEVHPEAWIAFANRGKKLNIAHSRGSVRYAATGDTAEEILERSRLESFDPNICSSREEAVERIAAMKSGSA